jgi:hypothetical protein
MVKNRGILQIALVALASLMCLSISPPALAAPAKAGASCVKSGQKSVVKKVTFLCSKSGKKLVWKAVVAKPVVKPVPTIKVPTVFDLPFDFDNLSANTAEISWLITKQEFANSKPASFNNNVVRGANVSDAAFAQSNGQLQKAINILSKYWVPVKITSIYFNEKDGEWIDQAISSAGGNPQVVTAAQKPYSVMVKEWGSRCGGGSAQKSASGPIWIQCLGTDLDKYSLNTVSPHEYFHIFQSAFRGTERKVQWADEGTANFFGAVVGLYVSSGNADDLKTFRSYQKKGFDAELAGLVSRSDLNGIASRYKALELGGNPTIDNSGYILGQYASEVLIAVGGWDRFMQLNMRLGGTASFAQSFEKLYGLKLDEFYPKIAAYVIKQ